MEVYILQKAQESHTKKDKEKLYQLIRKCKINKGHYDTVKKPFLNNFVVLLNSGYVLYGCKARYLLSFKQVCFLYG